jgi:hypothetical protein
MYRFNITFALSVSLSTSKYQLSYHLVNLDEICSRGLTIKVGRRLLIESILFHQNYYKTA